MGHRDGKRTRIALLLVVAALAIALAMIEALAGHGAPLDTAAPWAAHLERVDAALRGNHADVAARAWHEAHVAALRSRQWEGVVAVGDAARRIGQETGAAKVYDARARQAYLLALFRARGQQSLDGVLRVAEAFSALGDFEVVTQCLHLARGLLARSPDATAQARVTTLEQRLAELRSFATGPLRIEPF